MIRPNSQTLTVAKPEYAPYGLLSPAVKVVNLGSDWWLGGAIHELYDGGISYSVLADQGFDDGDTIREMVSPELGDTRFVHILPVTIEARVRSSTVGTTMDDLRKMAEDAIELVTQKALEEAFWEYLGSKYRSLANNTSDDSDDVERTVVSSSPVSSKRAQALLEGAVADNTVGYQPTLHFPRVVASGLELKEDDDKALKTVLGSYVVAGSGYSSKDQKGSALPDGQRAAYATGPVTVILGSDVLLPTDIPQAVNTANNVAEFFVQKPAMIAFSTKDVFSVLVDPTLDF